MKKVVVTFAFPPKTYILDNENDPVFINASDNDLLQLARLMFFIDLFQTTREEDILPYMNVIVMD